jgi:hypothetical protein
MSEANPNMMRAKWFATQDAPTPWYDQTVYEYKHEGMIDEITFLWTVPSKDTCEMYAREVKYVSKEEKELVKFVLEFYDGTLLKRAKQLNGEELNTQKIETR